MLANIEKTPESIESALAAIVLADPTMLQLDDVTVDDDMVVLTVTSTQAEAPCPVCGQPSTRIHSSYVRHPSDLALAGHRVQLHLNVRRFFCANPACARRTFAEHLPKVLKPFARRTQRLAETLRALGLALGGKAAARRAAQLATPVSRDTLLRLVRQSELPAIATPTILGIDDWAWKKGQRYGTILVDLEQQRVIDLLPERSADSVAAWLQRHPGVKIISRDRGGIYADGARRGAPEAQQVADRFHLLKNLREALEPLLIREHTHLPNVTISAPQSSEAGAAAQAAGLTDAMTPGPATAGSDAAMAEAGCIPSEVCDLPQAAETLPPKPLTRAEQIGHDRRQRRLARYQEILALYEQHVSIRSIARQMGVGRRTIRRYLAAGSFPERAQRQPRPSILDPFEPYLQQRWQAGYRNALQLYREIRNQGYRGSRSLLSHWAAQRRGALSEPAQGDTANRASPSLRPGRGQPENRRKLSPAQAAWLLVCKPEDLKAEQKTAVEQMRQASSEIASAYDLAQAFARMVREHTAEPLASWLEAVKDSRQRELHSFASGIRRDLAAVAAGLSSRWSQGQVEGQVNRLKFVKRSMYGRAKFDLLKYRVLVPT